MIWSCRSRCRPTATELLDFAGRHNLERVPQRSAAAHRHARAGEPQGPHRGGQRPPAARRHARLRLRRRRGLGRAHRVERQPHCTTPSGSSPASSGSAAASCCCRARCGWRRARATAARGSTAATATGWTRSPGASTGTCAPAPGPVGPRPPGHPQRLGGGLLRPRRSTGCSTSPSGPPRLGVERYVLDDGWFGSRRDDTLRAGRLGRLGRGLAARPAPAGRPGARSWACSSGSGSSRRWSTPTPTWPAPTRSGSWRPGRTGRSSRATSRCSTSASRRAYEHVKAQILAILDEYAIDYVKWDHNRDLIEAGTQPTAAGPACTSRPLAFYRLLDEIRAAHPGAGDRVVLVRRRPGRPRGARAHRPGLGLRQHRPARPAAHAALDHPADPARVPRLAHRLGPLAHHRPAARPGFRAGTAIFGHLGIEWDLTAGHRRPS